VADVKWSPNGKTILSLIIKTRRDEEETTVQLWDVDSGRLKFEVNVKGYGLTQFSPNGEQLLTYSGREDARLWDVETGRLIATLDPPQGSIAHRSYGIFSPDGRLLAIHSDERGIYIWDAVSGVLKTTVLEERKRDNCSLLGFSPNSKLLAVSREQLKSLPPTYSIELRDVVSGALRATLRGDNMKDAASQMLWSSDSQTLITAGGSQKYEGRIWDVKTGQLKTTFPMVAKESWIPMTFGYSNLDSLSVHPTLPVISAANYKFVRFWDLGTGELMQKIANTGSAVWSADGKLLLTFTSDVNTTQIWQVVSPPTSID
jgi:WD40 repeat protein